MGGPSAEEEVTEDTPFPSEAPGSDLGAQPPAELHPGPLEVNAD